METLSLCKREKNSAHSAKAVRAEGNVPGVIYGKKIGNLTFKINYEELVKKISIVGSYGVLNFDLQGNKGTAVIKELQKSPVSHKVIHLDLEEVAENERIESEVPIIFIGKELLGSKGLVLQAQKDLVKVHCTPSKLPKSIEVDLSKVETGKTYSFGDLKFEDGVSIAEDPLSVFAAITEEQKLVEEDTEETTEE